MVKIKKILNDNKVSVTELADRLKVTRQTVHYYINQGNKNSVDTLVKIAEAIDVPVTDLFEQPAIDVIHCPHCGGKIRVCKE